MDQKDRERSQPAFFSRQVKYVRSFHLDLAPLPDAGLTVVCGGFERCHPDYIIDRGSFQYLGLEFIASGSGSLHLAGQETPLTPGLVFCYGPGIPHRIVAAREDPPSKYFVDFAGRDAIDRLRECRLGPGALCHVANPAHIQRAFDDLIQDGLQGGALATPLCSSRLQYLLLRIAASLAPGHEDHTAAFATYLRAHRHVEDYYLRLTQLREIAQECGVSEAYLCRLFQRYDRETPYQFLTRLKMNRAAILLEDPSRLVKQIAAGLSYQDAYHFSRVFKKVFGISPRDFRQTFNDSLLSVPK